MTGQNDYFLPELDDLKRQLESRAPSTARGDLKWADFKPGITAVRILPPWDESRRWFMEVFKHSVGEDRHTCVQRTFPTQNLVCPICTVLKQLSDAGFKDDLDGLWPRYNAYMNVLVRGSEGEGPMIARFTRGLTDTIIGWINSPHVGVSMLHPMTGVDILITRTGTRWNDTKYSVSLAPSGRTPLMPTPEETDAFVQNLPKLTQVFKVPTPEIMDLQKESALQIQSRFTPGSPASSLPSLPPTASTTTARPSALAVPPPLPPLPVPAPAAAPGELERNQAETFAKLNLVPIAGRTAAHPICLGHHSKVSAVAHAQTCGKCFWELVCVEKEKMEAANTANG